MARFREIIGSFLAGEISPKSWGRADVEQYKEACERIENLIVLQQGGVTRRPGTQFKADLGDDSLVDPNDSAAAVRLFPFVISKTQAYVVVVTNLIAAPATDDPVDNGIAIWDVTNEEFLDITYEYLADANYTDIVQFTGYTTQAMINEITFVQIGNAIFFAQGDRIPWALEFRGNPTTYNAIGAYFMPFWAYSQLGVGGGVTSANLAKAWPYKDINTTALTLATNGTTSGTPRTITASNVSVYGADKDDLLGTPFRMNGDSNVTTGVALFSANPSGAFGTTMTALVLVTFEDTNASTGWSFASWSERFGWPRVVCYYQERLVYFGTFSEPNGFWASRQFNLADMRQLHYLQDSPNTVTNDDPFSGNIAAEGETAELAWAASGRTLAVGAASREFIIYGPDPATAWGPLNFAFNAETAYGGKRRMPVRLDSAILFLQWSGQRIREFLYNDTEDAYKSDDIMVNAEHIHRRVLDNVDQSTIFSSFLPPEVEQMVFQNSDNPVLWCIDRNGGLFGITRDKAKGVNAFHYHELGGEFVEGSESRPPIVKSVCVVPSPDGVHSDVYLAVWRTLGGESEITQQRLTMEKIGRTYEYTAPTNDVTSLDYKPVNVDSARYQSSMTAENEWTDAFFFSTPIEVIADGFYMGVITPNGSGVFTLPGGYEANQIIYGLAYTSYLRTVNINRGSVLGTSQGMPKSIDSITVRFVNTIGAKVGADLNRLYEMDFRPADLPMDEPIPLQTLDKEIAFSEGYDDKIHVHVVQDQGLPLTVTGIFIRGIGND